MINEYSKMYNKVYCNNAFSLFLFKSSRKNSICSDAINVNHLINHEIDRKISDERILSQFIGTLEKVVYYSLKYARHIEVSLYMDNGKNASYINANNALYHGTEYNTCSWKRVQFSSIEQFIDFLYSVYCMVYSYNELSLLNTVYNNPSVKYFINQYYKMEV